VGRTRHRLMDIIVMALCGVIANCDDWPDIALFARQRQSWFKRFLALPGGIPAHDTFERVFAALDPHALQRCCVAWLHDVAQLVGIDHIAIDGKTVRGSAGSTLGPLHLVSAWASAAQLTLGQVAVDGKSNEITAIPQLLELLDLGGALVTIDAIGCQKAIAKKIVAGGADYVLVVKGNQEGLLADIQQTVRQALDGQGSGKSFWRDGVSVVRMGLSPLPPFRGVPMQPMPKLDREAYLTQMRQQMETMLRQVADALNNAKDGEIIAGSECQVRDLFTDLRRQAFELGIQMRIDAAEAAFSPSAGRDDRPEVAP
jgi:hypothetical protein